MQDFMVATHSVVPCGHMFCGACLSEWLQKNPTCPKCRAAATAPPVRTMAVDNVLDSLVEKGMSAEELQERRQRKQHWESHAAAINAKMQGLFRHGAPGLNGMAQRGHHMPQHGAMMNWEAFAAMHGERCGINGLLVTVNGASQLCLVWWRLPTMLTILHLHRP